MSDIIKEYSLPEEFKSININVKKIDVNFNLIAFLGEVDEFDDIFDTMVKAPAIYSYFLNLRVDQSKLVDDLKYAMDFWEDAKYKDLSEKHPKSNVTAIKAMVKSWNDEHGECLYKKYLNKYKNEKYKLDKIDVIIKSIDKQMTMLQSIGAMKRYEIENILKQNGEYEKKGIQKLKSLGGKNGYI